MEFFWVLVSLYIKLLLKSFSSVNLLCEKNEQMGKLAQAAAIAPCTQEPVVILPRAISCLPGFTFYDLC